MSILDELYWKWPRSAYVYYSGMGKDPELEMTDGEWDNMGRKIVPDEHKELKGTNYEPGQGLFWLFKDDYPDWAKE